MNRTASALLLGLVACSDPPPPEAPDAGEFDAGRDEKSQDAPAKAIYGPPPTDDDPVPEEVPEFRPSGPPPAPPDLEGKDGADAKKKKSPAE